VADKLGPLLSSVAAGLLWAGAAIAEPSAADRATARSLAGEGFQALQSKDYAAAADRFGRADALVHAPTLTLDWARALVGLNQFVEAQERYELIIREGVDPKAPKSWQRALEDAKAELAELKPRLAWLTVTVTGPSEAEVTIDGFAVPKAAVGVRRAVNPGARNVQAVAQGFLAQRQTLNLAEGEETAVAFALEVDPDQQAPTAVVAKTSTGLERPPAKSRAPIYVALGVAGAGFVVGGVTGALALSKRSTLEKQCPDPAHCPDQDAGTINAYHTLGSISGAGFIVGVLGATTGVTLWLIDRKASAAPAQGFVVRPYLGLGSVGAQGSF
jgi:hypothetical protein